VRKGPFVKKSLHFVSGPFLTSHHLTIISPISKQIRLGDKAISILFNLSLLREILRQPQAKQNDFHFTRHFPHPHLKALVK